jgi:RNA polymerase sigma factor (sigma-70 family)
VKAEINKHRDLIEQAKKGNQLAQYKLYQKYVKAMFNICYRMLNNREEAEDLLQDSFTDVFKNLEKYRYESTIGAWIKRIVVNNCINAIKKKKVDMFLAEDLSYYDQIDDVDDRNVDYEISKVRQAMYDLPDGYRAIFSLYAMEGYDHSEIASIMDITESTSKTQYLRAKKKIKDLMLSNDDERQIRKVY